MNYESRQHQHEPSVPRHLDSEGRCLVCGLIVQIQQQAAQHVRDARREGVIEGLRIALQMAIEAHNAYSDPIDDIRAEIERVEGL